MRLLGLLLACPVCFSVDAERKSAYVVVTLSLLALTAGIAAAGGFWVWRLERRRSAQARENAVGETALRPLAAVPQEE